MLAEPPDLYQKSKQCYQNLVIAYKKVNLKPNQENVIAVALALVALRNDMHNLLHIYLQSDEVKDKQIGEDNIANFNTLYLLKVNASHEALNGIGKFFKECSVQKIISNIPGTIQYMGHEIDNFDLVDYLEPAAEKTEQQALIAQKDISDLRLQYEFIMDTAQQIRASQVVKKRSETLFSSNLKTLERHLQEKNHDEFNMKKYHIDDFKIQNTKMTLTMHSKNDRIYNTYVCEKSDNHSLNFAMSNKIPNDQKDEIIENICRMAIGSAQKNAMFNLSSAPQDKKALIETYLIQAAHEFNKPIVIDGKSIPPPHITAKL